MLKRQKLDADGYFQEQNTASLSAFFEVALHIAKQKSPNRWDIWGKKAPTIATQQNRIKVHSI